MKKELQAIILILFAFCSGMALTAATSGCDARDAQAAQIIEPVVRASVSLAETTEVR